MPLNLIVENVVYISTLTSNACSCGQHILGFLDIYKSCYKLVKMFQFFVLWLHLIKVLDSQCGIVRIACLA
jgi:hypothetical protein